MTKMQAFGLFSAGATVGGIVTTALIGRLLADELPEIITNKVIKGIEGAEYRLFRFAFDKKTADEHRRKYMNSRSYRRPVRSA